MSSSMPEFPSNRDGSEVDDDDYEDDYDNEFFEDEDDFNKFCRYRGQEVAGPQGSNTRGRYVCLHYYSNTVGMTFGDTNVEVYRMDQIKEWSTDPNWLDNLKEVLDSIAGKRTLFHHQS